MASNPLAFPRSRSVNHTDEQDGMSLLDYFAGQALPALIDMQREVRMSNTHILSNNIEGQCTDVAQAAYSIAEAMLIEREKRMKQ